MTERWNTHTHTQSSYPLLNVGVLFWDTAQCRTKPRSKNLITHGKNEVWGSNRHHRQKLWRARARAHTHTHTHRIYLFI